MNSIPYQESRLPDAVAYELRAGQGAHIPVFAPHWVRNHDNISVALSVNYELRSGLHEKRVYQMNRMLRKLGFAPAAPGEFALARPRQNCGGRGFGGGAACHQVEASAILRNLDAVLYLIRHFSPHGVPHEPDNVRHPPEPGFRQPHFRRRPSVIARTQAPCRAPAWHYAAAARQARKTG